MNVAFYPKKHTIVGSSVASFAPQGFKGILDAYASSIYDAWDVQRRLLVTSPVNLIRVRRSLDSLETDIGTSGGNLDTTALLAWTGSGSGYVTKLYGTTGDLVQATAARQLRIVNAGSLVTDSSGRPTMEYPSAGVFNYILSITATATFTQFITCQPVSTTGTTTFGGSFRTGDLDLWGVGMTSTNWLAINSVYAYSITLAGAAAGSRKAIGSAFRSLSSIVTWNLREGANNGTTTFSGNSTGSSVQLGRTGAGRSGDKISGIVHSNSFLSNTTMDAINTILAA